MRCLILILCLVSSVSVQASDDWLNRTVRVDLIVNRELMFNRHYDRSIERASERIKGAVNATNGQYPWSVMTTAWIINGEFAIGVSCTGTIISNNFVLSVLRCVNQNTRPPVNTIEVSIGTVQWNSTRSPTNFVRHYWYITPSPDNSPNIVLFRLHESIKFNPNVQPIRLPSHGNFSYDGWSSYRLGFVTPGAGLFSAQLTSIHTSILDNGLCSFNGNASDFEICGSDDSEPNESGPIMRVDAFSGGAWIVYEYTVGFRYIPVLIGIHQYQFANQSASFGYATRVSHFVEWIETLTAVLNAT